MYIGCKKNGDPIPVPGSIVSVGQKVRFDPFEPLMGFGACDNRGNYVVVTVVMVNEPHKWFSVVYDCGGVKQRTSFKFCDIGQAVTVCGH